MQRLDYLPEDISEFLWFVVILFQIVIGQFIIFLQFINSVVYYLLKFVVKKVGTKYWNWKL